MFVEDKDITRNEHKIERKTASIARKLKVPAIRAKQWTKERYETRTETLKHRLSLEST